MLKRGLIGFLIVLGLVLGGGALWLRFSPDPAGTVGPAPVAVGEDQVADTADGLVAGALVAAAPGNRPVLIDQIVTGYSTSNESAVPAEITTIRPILGCKPTVPMPGSLVGHVTAGHSGMPLAMTTYSDQHLAAAVEAFVEAYRSLGPGAEVTFAAPGYQIYDVAVTETHTPVYLVLETGDGNRIWNIHLAEGARIERVVLLGGDQAGVANLDPIVPVEVILSPGLAECGIVPAYAPTAGQSADADPAPGAQPMQAAALEQALVRAEAYDTWFRDRFGLHAGESRAGFDVGTISAIGPIPSGEAPLAVWTSLDGARLRTTHDLYLDLASQMAEGQDFTSRVMAIATGFAFGDLERLRIGGGF